MDWMSEAADEAGRHVAARLRSRFGSKAWTEFSARLSDHGERLFRLLHHLYGWRYDFAWIHERVVEATAEGFLDRSKALRRIDRKSDPEEWSSDPNSLLAMGYLDRYAGTVKGLRDRFDHLELLGVTHLHLLPPYATPEQGNDGGFAVSDYRRLRDGLGTTTDLAKVAAELRDAGVTLVLDMILSGTSPDHPWARAAASGDPAYRTFYFLFPDRELPNSYAPYLRSITPGREGGPFAWHPEVDGGAWVWTTMSPVQWDLNYSNPEVLAAVVTEMLFLANLGAGVIRINGEAFLWKQPGTDCENRPEAHLIVEILDTVARIAAPSISLISGAMVPSAQASFIKPGECRGGYNSVLTSAVWEAVATADTRLLAQALADRSSLPKGCAWITYLRSHDDIGWWFDDDTARSFAIDPEAHRRYLTAFYSGHWEGNAARGQIARDGNSDGSATISGTAAALAGLEAAVEGLAAPAAEIAIRRLLAASAVILGTGGIPMLFLGDEIAQLSDHSHLADADLAGDVRWSQRPVFDPMRLQSAAAGEGPEGAMLAGLRHLLEVRRAIDEFGPEIQAEPVELGDDGLLGFRRGSVMVIVNLTERPAIVARSNLPDGDLFDLVAGDTWDGHVLGPYEYRYLERPGAGTPMSTLRT